MLIFPAGRKELIMSATDFIIIHGSAVKFAAGKTETIPRDIDVVHGGNFSEADAIAVAKDWASKKGLPADLPIDCQRQYGWEGRVYLPVPCEASLLRYEIIAGEAEIVASVFKGLASYIRAYGHSAKSFSRRIKKAQPFRLGIVPKEWAKDDPDWGDWDDYTGGPIAIRSAIHHASDWQNIIKVLPFGKILERMSKEDPRPEPGGDFMKAFECSSTASSSLELFLVYRWGRWKITTQYPTGKLQRTWTQEELEKLLWPDSEWCNIGPATPDAPLKDWACNRCMVSWDGSGQYCPHCGNMHTHGKIYG
jgi:hypothetical protein